MSGTRMNGTSVLSAQTVLLPALLASDVSITKLQEALEAAGMTIRVSPSLGFVIENAKKETQS